MTVRAFCNDDRLAWSRQRLNDDLRSLPVAADDHALAPRIENRLSIRQQLRTVCTFVFLQLDKGSRCAA